ncbi:MAG: antitoxin VapB family protein [Nitrososphaerales archaeon]
MPSKNISITREAYEALSREKKTGESFTEAILRITEKNGKLSDCLGGWSMSDEESRRIFSELKEGWRKTTRSGLKKI